MDRMRACQSGFTSAVKQAKETSGAARRAAELAEAAAHSSAEKKEAEDVRIPAVPETVVGHESEPTRISVKKAPEARVRASNGPSGLAWRHTNPCAPVVFVIGK